MLGLQCQDIFHRLLPALHGLAGQPVHQVQGDVVEPGLPGVLHRLLGLGERVQPAQQGQLPVIAALHPERYPVEPRLFQLFKELQVHALRVAFHRDLRISPQAGFVRQCLQQAAQPFGAQQGRGAAAKIYGVYVIGRIAVKIIGKMLLDRLAVLIHHRFAAAAAGVKIAVGAFLTAKGHMDVNA